MANIGQPTQEKPWKVPAPEKNPRRETVPATPVPAKEPVPT